MEGAAELVFLGSKLCHSSRNPQHAPAEQGIAEGTLAEAAAADGDLATSTADGAADVAVHRATALMLDAARVSPDVALEYLPWLLAASPEDSLAVLEVRLSISTCQNF